MTLKLVSDNPNPAEESTSEPTLDEELHAFADAVEEDAEGVIALVIKNCRVFRVAWMGDDFMPCELMGLLEAAKLRVFADDEVED